MGGGLLGGRERGAPEGAQRSRPYPAAPQSAEAGRTAVGAAAARRAEHGGCGADADGGGGGDGAGLLLDEVDWGRPAPLAPVRSQGTDLPGGVPRGGGAPCFLGRRGMGCRRAVPG